MLHLKAWFSTSATAAASHDIELEKYLNLYKQINPCVSSATCEKMILHLWYLSD